MTAVSTPPCAAFISPTADPMSYLPFSGYYQQLGLSSYVPPSTGSTGATGAAGAKGTGGTKAPTTQNAGGTQAPAVNTGAAGAPATTTGTSAPVGGAATPPTGAT
jgi:hypothetical protein